MAQNYKYLAENLSKAGYVVSQPEKQHIQHATFHMHPTSCFSQRGTGSLRRWGTSCSRKETSCLRPGTSSIRRGQVLHGGVHFLCGGVQVVHDEEQFLHGMGKDLNGEVQIVNGGGQVKVFRRRQCLFRATICSIHNATWTSSLCSLGTSSQAVYYTAYQSTFLFVQTKSTGMLSLVTVPALTIIGQLF